MKFSNANFSSRKIQTDSRPFTPIVQEFFCKLQEISLLFPLPLP
ncbi:hypothetical protein LEP1GSC050_1523 [Leptospira broomii serovar Hurstbridge str. 5399]|uniref:Uncharacterized protein n=1 Tax=Leptospira broomii serovar Hurstbridge str. 5399 TaxID=1049789 RepID=T0F707_9LEPT|nr:hypothetical protein LEP1GSC050_1523 [Leptospira broomii serovar Hurstbridge str. 5399]